MPGYKFDKDVNTPKKERQWEHIYESMKSRGASSKKAIMAASGRVGKGRKKKSGNALVDAARGS